MLIRYACIGECMVELSLPDGPGGACRLGFAGDTLNVAVYLKRAAGERAEVCYVTALGADALSAAMIDFFAAEGLDTRLIERRPNLVPGLYAISLDEAGERSFIYWRDRSAARTLFLPPAAVTPTRLADFELLYLSGITLAILTSEARESLRAFLVGYRAKGGQVAFDSNYRPSLWPDRETAQREIGAFWAITDIGLPSLDDEMALFGDPDEASALARLRAAGVRQGALKRGSAGPLPIAWTGSLPRFLPAGRVVDTTAAGDSFNGAYLAALGAGAPEPDRLAAGHAMASIVIGHPGAIVPR